MRTKFAILLAVAVVLTSTAWGAWTDEVKITANKDSNETYFTNGHKVVFGSNGVGHVVWCGTKKKNTVYYARYYPSSGWGEQLVLSTSGLNPSIALDADGTTIHVVWWGYKRVGKCYYHIFYQKCVPTSSGTGGWVGDPVDICQSHTTGRYHQNPAVACPPGTNNVVVSWEEKTALNGWKDYSLGFRECASGTWSAQLQLDGPSSFYRYFSSVSVAPNGNVFVAYYGLQSPGQTYWHVYVKSRIGSNWQQTEDATPTSTATNYYYCDVDANPQTNNPHIVCHNLVDDGGRLWRIVHNYHTAGGWQVPEVVYDPGPGDTNRINCQPSLAFDANGKSYVAWSDYARVDSGYWRGLLYSVCPAEGETWTSPAQVSSTSSHAFAPSLTVSSAGVYAVWTDEVLSAPWQVLGKGLPSSTYSGLSAGTAVPSNEFALDVSPNPASRKMVVNYSLPVAGNVSLKLYDVSGALAKTVACGYVLPGSHAVSLSREGLARGAYILKLQSGASSVTRKLVIE